MIGDALLAELQASLGRRDAGPALPAEAAPVASVTPADETTEWRIRMRFQPGVLVNGTNPLLLLEELRGLGACTATPDISAVPGLETLDPTACLVAWTVTLATSAGRGAIEDVFMFVSDEMELSIEPLGRSKMCGSWCSNRERHWARGLPIPHRSRPTGSTCRPGA